MATFDALERLQKFDWLIQKLHCLRSTLHTENGLQELHKLQALQLLQKSDYHLNGSAEDEKMELCREEEEDEEEEEVVEEEEDDEYLKEDEQILPLALTTSECGSVSSTATVSGPPPTSFPSTFSPTFPPPPSPFPPPPTAFPPPPKPVHEGERRNGFSPVRFPTGIFPPLPFEGMFGMLGEDNNPEMKVGKKNFLSKFVPS